MTDARSRPVTLLDPYELNLRRRHAVIPAETLHFLAGQVGFGVSKGQYRAFLAVIIAFSGGWMFLFIWEAIRRNGFDMMLDGW